MVKWKKMNKKMAGLLLGVMMLFTASTTAFAYVDESAEASKVETTQTDQSTDKEEKKDEAASTNEVLPEDGTDQGTAFTTPGNGEVKDDITDDSTKEFLTVTTKNNNTFYIVIDRSATSQNVYMLSQIDENDLSEFLDKDSTATVVTPQPDTSKVVLDETNNEDVDKEATVDPEKTASTKTNMGVMATILILALGGVAAYYYFIALFERHGQPLEVVIQQMIQCCFIRPKERPYQTNNAYAALVRQYQMEQEVKAIVQKNDTPRTRKAQKAHPRPEKRN